MTARTLRSAHLFMDVGKEVVEALDVDQAEPRKFHVGHDIERCRQRCGKYHHVNPAACRRRRHAETGEQRTAQPEAEQHGTAEQRIANYRYNRAQRNILPFYMAKWLGISICLLKMTEVLSGLMLSTQAQARNDDHLFAALSCMSAGIAFAFSCIVLLMLATSYLYLSWVER